MTGPTASRRLFDAALSIKAQSFLIDGEVIIIGDDGTHDFNALRSRAMKRCWWRST
jgi:ATP-dependent DNA ligase